MSREAVFSGALVVILAWALWKSLGFGFRAGLFPWALGGPVLALAIVQLVIDLRGQSGNRGTASLRAGEDALPTAVIYRRAAGICGWVVGFFAALWLLGIALAVPVTTFRDLKVGAGEKWPISLVVTAGLWLFLYGLFVHTLQCPFPKAGCSAGCDS